MKALVDGEQEVWLPVVGYEGLYEVSSLGGVRSLDRIEAVPEGRHSTSWTRIRRGKVLRQRVSNTGYLQTMLSKDGKSKNRLVHRIVAESFLPETKVKMEVNHKDGDRLNNNSLNLEWVTRRENALHSTRVLKKNKGSQSGTSKLTEHDVLEIVSEYENGRTLTDIAAKFDVTIHCVYRIVRGFNWNWLTGILKEVTCDDRSN